MKKKNFTESKILSIIKQHGGGRVIDDVCREDGARRRFLSRGRTV